MKSKQKPGPSPDEIKRMRGLHGLTQTKAAELIHASMRAWQDYEGGRRRMHPGLWDLFKRKLAS